MAFRNVLIISLIVNEFTASAGQLSESSIRPAAFEIRFADHHFAPRTLVVPAGQPLMLTVVNSSRERIEFESFKLNREKVVGPGETITVRLPALRAGSYDFFDDFHPDVSEGEIVAK
jgi:Cupredoxin-like domain